MTPPPPTAIVTFAVGSTVVISPPYPNPNYSPVAQVDVSGTGLTTIQWDVFTAAFRKIRGQKIQASTYNHLVWDLRDAEGSPVSDGIYYLRIEADSVNGKNIVTKKVLVLK